MKRLRNFSGLLCIFFLAATFAGCFEVDRSPAPATYYPEEPADGEVVAVNPPSMVWRPDKRAASYRIEFSQDAAFRSGVIRAEEIPYSYYNHSAALTDGRWFWRYFVKTAKGDVSAASPARSFVVKPAAVKLPIPPIADILKNLPRHPRVFVTPDTLAAFRDKRNHAAREAWASVRASADAYLKKTPRLPAKRIPIAEAKIKHSAVSLSQSWKPGQPIRRQVFWVDAAGKAFWTPDYSFRDLSSAAEVANVLSFAYLASGDERYAQAARKWVDFVSEFRLDYHLNAETRADHDTVVYAYEQGLKAVALSYDRLYDLLAPEERTKILAHIDYHVDSAGRWLVKRNIVVEPLQSHPQQCMHTLLTTLLAAAGDSKLVDKWARYIVPQYANRIAWTSPDGGYFEGQTYGHKFGWILEGLAAIRSACGIDLFQRPEARNAGPFWLYAMNLNYWFNHWGDNYSLIWPYANPRDAYISAFLGSMTQDPYVKWYSETVRTNPAVQPFQYLSASQLAQRPPIDIAQARAFPETGVVSAYDRFYDHGSARIFFRSSPWGAHSHSHADQNAFVIHAGGEILAPDTGYYTYSHDTYHANWTRDTAAHNSILVDGEGQIPSIDGKGKITEFFHAGRQDFFTGDASAAYYEPLSTFRRGVVFIRPDTWVVYDELQASEPVTFQWTLNTFSEPQIEADAHKMTSVQRAMRLQIDHLLPKKLVYATGNKRPYPLKTPGKLWSRYSEAFPQAWHTEAGTPERSKAEAFLALMQAYPEAEGAPKQSSVAIENKDAVGLRYEAADGRQGGTILFHRNLSASGVLSGGGIDATAKAATVLSTKGQVSDWMLVAGKILRYHGNLFWQSEKPASASALLGTPSAKALIRIDGNPGALRIALAAKPDRVFVSLPDAAKEARALPFDWQDGALVLDGNALPGESVLLWVDPVRSPLEPLASGSLTVTDAEGSYDVPLTAAWDEQGEVVYFAESTPRVAGDYAFAAAGAQLLVQDRWDRERTTRGADAVTGTFREGTWVFVRQAADKPAHFTAQLEKSYAGEIDNLVENGGFEVGIPSYPPRGWTLSTSSRVESLGWGGWSQENPAEGKSALRFFRDKAAATLVSQPMRLMSGGAYHLSFQSRGDLSGASIRVRGAGSAGTGVKISPQKEWTAYEAEMELSPGYCTVEIILPEGNSQNTLWVDALRLGKIHAPDTPAQP